jgi:hypothetical protein
LRTRLGRRLVRNIIVNILKIKFYNVPYIYGTCCQ